VARGGPRVRLDRTSWGLLLLLGVTVAVGALRWVDATWQPVIIAQTAGPLVAVAVALLFIVSALLHRWLPLAVAGVAMAVVVVVAAPAFIARTAAPEDGRLTVMSANLLQGEADALQVMDAVRTHGADVLVLVEVTPEAVGSLREEGLDTHFSRSAGEALENSVHGTLVYSRYPLEVTDADTVGPDGSLQPEVVVTVAGTAVRLKAVHATAPLAGRGDEWRESLADLRGWRDDPGDDPLVLVGDFNASWGHPVFRSVAQGLLDAHREAGLGWVRTWPYSESRLPPYVQLDHLLSRGLDVTEAGTVAVHGTDHAIVWATYDVPEG
jgi:endonuclease/exonuclease/phosphatase (EEP) superfamily protein YafD